MTLPFRGWGFILCNNLALLRKNVAKITNTKQSKPLIINTNTN